MLEIEHNDLSIGNPVDFNWQVDPQKVSQHDCGRLCLEHNQWVWRHDNCEKSSKFVCELGKLTCQSYPWDFFILTHRRYYCTSAIVSFFFDGDVLRVSAWRLTSQATVFSEAE